MDWKAGFASLIHLFSGDKAVSANLERGRLRFLQNVKVFFMGVDHTLLVCFIAVCALAVVFWFSLRLKRDF